MTEFWLILAINVAGLAFALSLSRWLVARDAGTAETRRLGAAVERASKAFVARELRAAGIVVGAFAVLLFVAHATLAQTGTSSLEAGFTTALGVVLGAVSCGVAGYSAAELSVRGSLRTTAASQLSLDRALVVSIRAGGAVVLFVEAVAALGVFGSLAMALGFRRAAPADIAVVLWPRLASIVAGYAFGAVATALALQRGGATYHGGSDVAADIAGERDAALDHDDARNPAVISDLVGDHVGVTVVRAADQFLIAVCANIAALLIGAAVFHVNERDFAAPLALLGFPIAVRAFAGMASPFGIMVVRCDEINAGAGIWRGHVATCVVGLAALAGTAFWLLGSPLWSRFMACGAVGLVGASVAAMETRRHSERRSATFRDLAEALRGGESTAVSQGLAVGLRTLLLPVVAVTGALTLAWHLGASSGIARGGLLGAGTAALMMVSATSYASAVSAWAAITDTARGVLAMTAQQSQTDGERRAARLDDAAFSCNAAARTYLVVAGGSLALLLAAALPSLAKGPGAALSLRFGNPITFACAGLGAAAVLAYVGAGVRAAARAARQLAGEVDRQVAGFPRDNGTLQVPRDFTPSYRACIELAHDAGMKRLVPAIVLPLLLPVTLGLALRTLRLADPLLATTAMNAFVMAASATAVAAALALEGARAACAALRRAAPAREASSTFTASLNVDAVGDVVGGAGASAAHLLIKSAALVAMTAAPFLT